MGILIQTPLAIGPATVGAAEMTSGNAGGGVGRTRVMMAGEMLAGEITLRLVAAALDGRTPVRVERRPLADRWGHVTERPVLVVLLEDEDWQALLDILGYGETAHSER